MIFHKISIIGLGRVGLVTAACFAKKGYKVIGIDRDDERLEQVRNAEAPFFEPDLPQYLKEAVSNGALLVARDLSSSTQSDLTFVTVGTPTKRDGGVDLEHVKDVVTEIGRSLRNSSRNELIVIKSTVIPGTARNLVKPILQKESGKIAGRDFRLCSNPEFLREGSAVHDAEFPDRIVIGSDDPEAIRNLEQFYKEIHAESIPPIIKTSYENAELIKYVNNAFLATKVSFANCIANIVERVPHADVGIIVAGIGLDQRIGPGFLNAGLGWGGSCFPKDLQALVAFSRTLGYDPELVEAAIAANSMQSGKAVELAKRVLNSLRGRRVAVLGLAYKPKTDDMREAVSIPIIRGLLAGGAVVVAYDPAAMENARAIFDEAITYARDPIECIHKADCCIIVTEWDEFKTISPNTFIEQMREPVVIDGRRIYDVEEFSEAGIVLSAIGLGPRT